MSHGRKSNDYSSSTEVTVTHWQTRSARNSLEFLLHVKRSFEKPGSNKATQVLCRAAGVFNRHTLSLLTRGQVKHRMTPADFLVQKLNLNLVKPLKQHISTGDNVWGHLWLTLRVRRARSAPGRKRGARGAAKQPKHRDLTERRECWDCKPPSRGDRQQLTGSYLHKPTRTWPGESRMATDPSLATGQWLENRERRDKKGSQKQRGLCLNPTSYKPNLSMGWAL